MKPPDVSVIIVSFNTKACLARCLAAIPESAGHLVVEVIVVDNGSSDGSQAMVTQEFPKVRLIQNRENLGYGSAHNVGAGISKGDALLLLNGDCEMTSSVLTVMYEALRKDPSLGVVFCRLVNSDGSLQPSVHQSFPSPWSLIDNLFFLTSLRYSVYRRPVLHRWFMGSMIRAHARAHDVAWGGGACLLVRRKAFEAVGGFDEQFFMYYEDIDLCKRIGMAGYRLHYLPDPSAIHHWGRSTKQAPVAMLRATYRSRVYYFEKHFSGWGGAVARGISLIELTIRCWLFTLAASVPLHHRDWFRDRAAANAASLEDLRTISLCAADGAPAHGNSALPFVLALVILLSAFAYFHDVAKFIIEAPFIDFAFYYTYSTMVTLGLDLFDPSAVAQVDAMLGIHRAHGGPGYPPLFFVFMQPWVWVPFRVSAIAWLVVNQVLLLAALQFCFRRYPGASPIQVLAALFVVLNFQPLLEDIALGQSNIVLLFLVTIAWWSLRHGRVWIAAIAVALPLHIKVQYGLLLPILWWMGRREVCVRAVVIVVFGYVLSLWVFGPVHLSKYFHYIVTFPDHPLTWIGNLSPRATFHRLLDNIALGRGAADSMVLALDGLLIVLLFRAIPRHLSLRSEGFDWAWSLGVTSIFLLSPHTEEHHLVILLFPITLLLLNHRFDMMPRKDSMVLLGSLILLGSRYSFWQFTVFHQGVLSLLTMGKILGVACLALVLIRRLHSWADQQKIPEALEPQVIGKR